MTARATVQALRPEDVPNPYLDLITRLQRGESVDLPQGAAERTGEPLPFSFWEITARRPLCTYYAWAFPNAAALEAIAALRLPVHEVAAGTGYWASLLHACGVEVTATDVDPGRCYALHEAPRVLHFPVTQLDAVEGAVQAAAQGAALLFCWPALRGTWPEEALRAYLDHGGQTVIYIGEGEGGCTGTDEFHTLLLMAFKRRCRVTLPQWDTMHDALTIYQRRGPT